MPFFPISFSAYFLISAFNSLLVCFSAATPEIPATTPPIEPEIFADYQTPLPKSFNKIDKFSKGAINFDREPVS